MKIIFSGGGTLGPVTPLLAFYEIIKAARPSAEFFWIGSRRGLERQVIEGQGIRFTTIVSGKLRRYFSLLNIVDIFRLLMGFVQALAIIWQENPDLCVSAGGYVSVPVHWAAWLLGVPTWIHQQDRRVGLANRLMAPFARVITTAWEEHGRVFSTKKTVWLGSPARSMIRRGRREAGRAFFHLDDQMPVVFVTGGGTGSERLNQLVIEAVPHLSQVCQIIHTTGPERPQEQITRAATYFPFYHAYKFLGAEMKDAYAVADLVVSRGGFGTLTELAAFPKAAIVIPKPGQQEENVFFLAKSRAVVMMDESTNSGYHLAAAIKELLRAPARRQVLAEKLQQIMPLAKTEALVKILDRLVPASINSLP
ncbi:MAG: UDP-N-acetylglucosamine--N-acetylmuramyl-(pentapeptide) pyrophosphoryl-undecaprenol N-acetylglucosamine transferase [Candidatus Magasanikbacteria bacterium]|nr:UDP-N-acetylglucosamine--N-acetylmuramyl-(pentapeptide) pyrophosphoryl-undecaprenol N-acetylglucosamine transferase [Candidatus Magasanikbacteria bacterium]